MTNWSSGAVSPDGARVTLPEYFHLVNDGKKSQWVVVQAADVPAKAGLADVHFERPREKAQEAYDTPEAPDCSFKNRAPLRDPSRRTSATAALSLTFWYRFADQPALLNADLTREEREQMQAKVEKLHRAWTKDRDYLAPPTVGTLVDLDPAQIVTPPKGLEVGYVPSPPGRNWRIPRAVCLARSDDIRVNTGSGAPIDSCLTNACTAERIRKTPMPLHRRRCRACGRPARISAGCIPALCGEIGRDYCG